MKRCPLCGGEVPSRKRVDAAYCSAVCRKRASGRRFSARHPDRVQANSRKQNNNTPTRIITRIKHRAKLLGCGFDLVPGDIIVPTTCPVLGIAIYEVKARYNNPHAPSVDRINPSRGYTRDNIRVISNRANLLKSNATIEELEAILADLRRLRETRRHGL